jgi:hypothetical protein
VDLRVNDLFAIEFARNRHFLFPQGSNDVSETLSNHYSMLFFGAVDDS